MGLKSRLYLDRDIRRYPRGDRFIPFFPLVELPERYRDIPGEREVPDLGVAAEFHGHFHEPPGVGTCFPKPDMEYVAAIDNGEEDMLDIHTFCQRDICTGRNMGAVGIVDGQVATLAQLSQPFFEIALDNRFCKVMVAPVEQVRDREPLAGGFGRCPGER